MLSVLIVVASVSVLAINVSADHAATKCPVNELYQTCGTACPKTCKNKDALIKCIATCKIGCFCREGWVRKDDGVCVDPSKCPSTECPVNEQYKTCGTACPKTCKNKDALIKCVATCKIGCFCREGWVRNDDGLCVEPSQCPSTECNGDPHAEPGCQDCRKTCASLADPPRQALPACPTVPGCEDRCACKAGYVKDETSDTCVLPERCPNINCGLNQQFDECAFNCTGTDYCRPPGQPPVPCSPPFICNGGCICKEGYKIDANGNCIREEDCPDTECLENEEYKTCGTACPKTCKNKDIKINCIALCKEGCFCREGWVRNDDGLCVEPSQCCQ